MLRNVLQNFIAFKNIDNIRKASECCVFFKCLIFAQIFVYRFLIFAETIWATTVETCQQVQNLSPNAAEQALWELHWRQIFGLDAFRYILQHILQYTNASSQHPGPNPK